MRQVLIWMHLLAIVIVEVTCAIDRDQLKDEPGCGVWNDPEMQVYNKY